MFEYRVKNLNENIANMLKILQIDIVEEEIYGEVEFIFYHNKDLTPILEGIEFSKKEIDETGWQSKWKEYLTPGMLTPNIAYVFDESDKKRYQKSIMINPALAFGTGSHPTTKIAATLVEKLLSNHFCQNMLDVGCGSGILSILASKCGAKRVYGFDIDKVAIFNAKGNVLLNNCENVYLWAGNILSIKKDMKFDIVCANIISNVLLDLKKYLFDMTKKYLVVSGILEDEMENFTKLFYDKKFFLKKTLQIENWSGAVYKHVCDNR